MKGQKVLFASARTQADREAGSKDTWGTPESVKQAIRSLWPVLELDPCADADPMNWFALNNYSGPAGNRVDGLTEPWRAPLWGSVFANPPYAQAAAWCRQFRLEYECGNVAEGMLLIAARTDTRAWQEATVEASAICFIRGRLRFIDRPGHRESANSAGFPSALVYLGDRPGWFSLACQHLGPTWKPLEVGRALHASKRRYVA